MKAHIVEKVISYESMSRFDMEGRLETRFEKFQAHLNE